MKTRTKLTVLGSALAFGAVAPPAAMAGGIQLYELGTADVGLASAGYAARADDPATVFKNPAGMSRLDGVQAEGGLQLDYINLRFDPNADTSARLGTDDGGNAVGWLPGGSLFASDKLSDRWSVGLGVVNYFGAASEYNDDWVGRYYVQKSAMLGLSILPTASYRATDWLSIGAGLNAMYGVMGMDVAVNNGPLAPDGQLEIKTRTWGFGANVGILIEPAKGTRIGLTYLSPVQLDFSDTPSITGPQPAGVTELDLGLTVPQSVMLSFYQDLNEQWAVMADFGWQNWAQFGEIIVGVDAGGVTSTVNANYQDTFHGALGAQYRPTEQWQFSTGMAFDSSAVDSEHRTVTVPMGRAWRFGVGGLYHASPKLDVGLAYEFVWAGDMSVDQGSDLSLRGRVAGSYEDTWYSFLALNLTYKF